MGPGDVQVRIRNEERLFTYDRPKNWRRREPGSHHWCELRPIPGERAGWEYVQCFETLEGAINHLLITAE